MVINAVVNAAINFVAIKIGDLNESASVNSLQAADDRSTEKLTLTTENQMIEIGELVSFDVSAQTLESILGYQFTLNFNPDALDFVQVTPGQIGSINDFGLTLLDKGAITTAWDCVSAGQSVDALRQQNTPLFQLTFRAKTDGMLHEMIQLNSRFTLAEAYNAAGDALDAELIFTTPSGNPVASESFDLYQNLPNPFGKTTTIGFHLPETTTATLTIMDITGKTLQTIVNKYEKGYHQIDISKTDLNATGLLYYRLDTPTNTATKKMMLLID